VWIVRHLWRWIADTRCTHPGRAEGYCCIARQLSRIFLNEITDGERSTPSTVKILADMRRCAFDLDFLISRQPRESPADNGIGESHQPQSRFTTMPARNFAPNELEYLDVFGFFNVGQRPSIHEQTSDLVQALGSPNERG
jgi:hypothetical protein